METSNPKLSYRTTPLFNNSLESPVDENSRMNAGGRDNKPDEDSDRVEKTRCMTGVSLKALNLELMPAKSETSSREGRNLLLSPKLDICYCELRPDKVISKSSVALYSGPGQQELS